GRSQPARAVAALSLGVGAFVVLQTRHGMFVATTAWVPWILWSIERFAVERRRSYAAAFALTLAMALYAGGWSMLVYGGLVITIYGAARIASARPERVRPFWRRADVQMAAGLAGAALLGVALAAAEILPALAHARISPRALGLTYAEAS